MSLMSIFEDPTQDSDSQNSFTPFTPFTDLRDKYALAIYLFLYLEFHNEFATTTNQLCYSEYMDELLMTIVQSRRDYGICNVLLF